MSKDDHIDLISKSFKPKSLDDAYDTPTKSNIPTKETKYLREIKPGILVDVYDVLAAWRVSNPALQHLIKKALQAGNRGHKDLQEDLDDIVVSAKRAKDLGDRFGF